MGLGVHVAGVVADGTHLGCAVEGVLAGIVPASDGRPRVVYY